MKWHRKIPKEKLTTKSILKKITSKSACTQVRMEPLHLWEDSKVLIWYVKKYCYFILLCEKVLILICEKVLLKSTVTVEVIKVWGRAEKSLAKIKTQNKNSSWKKWRPLMLVKISSRYFIFKFIPCFPNKIKYTV